MPFWGSPTKDYNIFGSILGSQKIKCPCKDTQQTGVKELHVNNPVMGI